MHVAIENSPLDISSHSLDSRLTHQVVSVAASIESIKCTLVTMQISFIKQTALYRPIHSVTSQPTRQLVNHCLQMLMSTHSTPNLSIWSIVVDLLVEKHDLYCWTPEGPAPHGVDVKGYSSIHAQRLVRRQVYGSIYTCYWMYNNC